MNPGLTDTQIAGCFNRGLGRELEVRLIGGAEEPFYEPGTTDGPARIRYTRDYAASALHELAHWCIAGTARRRMPDYGYWYQPPPRTAAQQAAFLRVEAPVQALEARLAAACGLTFSVSMDDLKGSTAAFEALRAEVAGHLSRSDPLPKRALRLIQDLGATRQRIFGVRSMGAAAPCAARAEDAA
jgi:elongation factor P hydroxylase